MAYDPATGDVVLFGGYGSSGLLDDTWTWNGTTWTGQSPATSPPVREGAAMAFDPGTGDVVLFGGYGTGLLNDTWTWDGTTWTEHSPATSAAARWFASMAYDPGTGDMVLFAGAANSGYLNDTWTYGPSAPQYTPTVSQTLSPSSPVLVNTPVTDTATLTGAGPTAGGTVSYGVYSDSGCTDLVASLGSSVAVTNGAPGSSDPWTAAAGDYWFQTTYTGDSADTGPVSSSCDTFTVDNPAIGLVKTASIANYSAPNTAVTYSYAVTNTGNAALTNVTVTDPMVGLSAVNCGSNSNVVASLAAGSSVTCTASYTTSQTDVDAGSITNTGTAVGTPPVGPNVSANDSLTIPAVQNPAIGLTKSASISGFSTAGTPVTYSYQVTNSGNMTLTSVSVADPMVGLSTVGCPSPTLAPAATETCSATYTTTQADVDAGSITNTGTATGTPPLPGPNATATSTITVPARQGPAIGIVKSASVKRYSAPGTPVTYSYKVTNSGNVTLHSVTVTDPMKGLSAVTCPSSSLAPTASETCSATYTTTQADVDKGWIKNTGTATGTPPSGAKVTASASVVVPAVQNPKVAIVKSANISSFSAPGTKVTYSYKVTDTGNVTLHSVSVVDPMFFLSKISCPTNTLSPTATETCTATYTTTQADVKRGSIRNIGTAFALAPEWTWVAASSTVVVPYVAAAPTPSIGIVKTTNGSNGQDIPVGSAVSWSYAVTNTGAVALTNVTVTDNKVRSSAITCPGGHSNTIATLAAGASVTCTATGTAVAGNYANIGTATGTPSGGRTPVTATSTGTYFGSAPAIGIVKSASVSKFTAAGTKVTYSYKVTNTGNVTLNPVTVTDPMVGLSAISCPATSLAPAATETCSATYTTTQADVKRGSISNTGTATGTPPVGATVTATSSVVVPYKRS